MLGYAMVLSTVIGAGPTAGATEPFTTGAARLDLRWTAPPSCPSAIEIRDEIERLGPTSTDPAATLVLVVDANVQAVADGFALELVVAIEGDRSERRLQSTDCDDLARATALVAATMADPIAIAQRVVALQRAELAPEVTVPDPVVEPSPTLPPVATADAATPTARIDRRSRRRAAASLRVEGLAGVAALPRADAGLSLVTGIALRRARIELGAMHVFAQTRDHPTLADVALRVRATAAVGRACGVPRLGAWEFPLCGGGELGVMSALGEGDAVRDAQRVRRPWAAAFVEAHAAWRVTPRIALWIGLQGLVALAKPEFTVGALEPFVATRAGGGRAKLGVEVRFP